MILGLTVPQERSLTQRVVYVPGIDLMDGLDLGTWISVGPTGVADYQELAHVLVLYMDRREHVIAAASGTMAP